MKPLLFRSLLLSLLAIVASVFLPFNIQKTEATEAIASAPLVAEGEALSSKIVVVGNKDTKRYHLPGMRYYRKVKKYHRVYFDSEQQAIANGYYKAGTGKDLTGSVRTGGKSIKERIVPAAAVSAILKGNLPEALPENEKASEIKAQDASKVVGVSPKPTTGEIKPEKTVAQETVVDAQVTSPSPGARTENPAVLKANEPPVKIEADNMSYDSGRDVYSAEGNVIITYDQGVLTADHVEFDRTSNLVTAQGGAFLKMAGDTLQGDKMVVNVEDNTGIAYHSKAFYALNHFYIKGDRIEKTGENTYFIEQPVATTCDGDHPSWEIAGSSMNVTLEGYGWMKNARLTPKGTVPVIYSPIVAFPAKTKRQSGFLFPYLAYSKDKNGMDVEVPFFWAINPQMDATIYSRYMEKRGVKEGVEFRYFAGSKSFGTFYGDYLNDTSKYVSSEHKDDPGLPRDWNENQNRWSYYLNHQTNFDSQFYIRTDLRRVSDPWYFRDFSAHNYYLSNYATSETNPFRKVPFEGNASLPSLESSARLYKGWENYTLAARVSYTDNFAALNNDTTLQQYPEIIFTSIKRQFFSTPFYHEFTGTYDYFYRNEGQKGHYVDLAPTISLPFNLSNYAKLTPQITLHETYWNRDDSQTTSDNRSGTRTNYNAGLAISSQISRVFSVNIQNWEKIRHEIKPEILYSYIPNIRQDNFPNYLPVIYSFMDTFAAQSLGLVEQNAVAWSLTNTLTARTKGKNGTRSYLELLRLKLLQVYDINEAKRDTTGSTAERRPFSDVVMELDLKPHPYFFLAARNKYSPYDSYWKETNYDLGINDWRGDSLTLGYRYTRDSIKEINLYLKAVITERLTGKMTVRLDGFNNQDVTDATGRTTTEFNKMFDKKIVENTVGLVYQEQCWGVGVDYTKTSDDQIIMLKLSLAGLAMFGF